MELNEVNQGNEFNEFEVLERVALRLLEQQGAEILNHEKPARNWAHSLIAAGAPINLVVRQFGRSIAHEPRYNRNQRADDPTSLGFMLFEFWEMDGQALPNSIRQAWNSKNRKQWY